MRIGSLCTGYGGIELGLRMAGVDVDVRWYAEVEPGPAALLAETHPGVPNIGDIKAAPWSELEGVEMIVGGIPCQPTSRAGKGLGDADPRWLWPATRDALTVLRPSAFLLENVPGLVTHDKGRLFAGIIADLEELGYGVTWIILGACHIGAGHHRHRVFLLAEAGGVGRGRLSAPACGQPNGVLLPTPVARDGAGRGEGGPEYWAARRQRGRPLGAEIGLLARMGGWGDFAAAIGRHELLRGPAPAPADKSRTGGPRLRPEFSEWLMCLPPGHVTGRLERRAALKALGNGVVPPQLTAAWLYLTGQVPARTLTVETIFRKDDSMTLTEFAVLLRQQGAIKRNNKRDPRFADIPAAVLIKLADVADVELAATGNGWTGDVVTQPELGEGVREMTTHEALEAMSPITGDKAIAELETVEASVPAYDLARYGFRAPAPVSGVSIIDGFDLEADPYAGMDPTEAYLRGLGDQPPARDPFVAPAPVTDPSTALSELAAGDAGPKESTGGSPSPVTEDVSASDSPTTEPSSRPTETLIPSMAGDGSYVKGLTISATPPPQPPPFTGEPGDHYGPGLPASQYPNAPEADPKA